MKQQYTSIGVTGKAKGVKGLLKVRVEPVFEESFAELKILFLPVDGQLLPFFIEEVTVGPELLVKLETVDSKEAAHKLSGKEIFAQENLLPKRPIADHSLSGGDYPGFQGFRLFDEMTGEVGMIEEVMELPQQWMAVVRHQGKELLIPLNEHLIRRVDAEEKQLHMGLPEGLLEL